MTDDIEYIFVSCDHKESIPCRHEISIVYKDNSMKSYFENSTNIIKLLSSIGHNDCNIHSASQYYINGGFNCIKYEDYEYVLETYRSFANKHNREMKQFSPRILKMVNQKVVSFDDFMLLDDEYSDLCMKVNFK